MYSSHVTKWLEACKSYYTEQSVDISCDEPNLKVQGHSKFDNKNLFNANIIF